MLLLAVLFFILSPILLALSSDDAARTWTEISHCHSLPHVSVASNICRAIHSARRHSIASFCSRPLWSRTNKRCSKALSRIASLWLRHKICNVSYIYNQEATNEDGLRECYLSRALGGNSKMKNIVGVYPRASPASTYYISIAHFQLQNSFARVTEQWHHIKSKN